MSSVHASSWAEEFGDYLPEDAQGWDEVCPEDRIKEEENDNNYN